MSRAVRERATEGGIRGRARPEGTWRGRQGSVLVLTAGSDSVLLATFPSRAGGTRGERPLVAWHGSPAHDGSALTSSAATWPLVGTGAARNGRCVAGDDTIVLGWGVLTERQPHGTRRAGWTGEDRFERVHLKGPDR